MNKKAPKYKSFIKFRAALVLGGKTQPDIAKLLGISHQALSNKLSGKTQFYLGEMIAICNYLNAPIDIFFDPKTIRKEDVTMNAEKVESIANEVVALILSKNVSYIEGQQILDTAQQKILNARIISD